MEIDIERMRHYRLRAHHLDQKIPPADLISAAGACGLQNSPPGAWETALFNRLTDCSLPLLHDALYRKKSLLQAWSFRGAPVVFPTRESAVFLSALIAEKGEEPWIYTTGIAAALEFVRMPFDDLLLRTKEAARQLDRQTIKSKEALDRTLSDIIRKDLPPEKQTLWNAPSMYGRPDKQTVGDAMVSFLLRPCSFYSLVVFGERQGVSPTFTSFWNWIGHPLDPLPEADKALTRKFLHCYGPATKDSFMRWLGCSRQQAQRLWDAAADEMEPVTVSGKISYMLTADMDNLRQGEKSGDRLMLLGAHDPYLDIRDKSVLLESKALHAAVWKTVANPGVVLKGGRIVGIWKPRTQENKLDIALTLFEALRPAEYQMLKMLAEEYAVFRMLDLRSCRITSVE